MTETFLNNLHSLFIAETLKGILEIKRVSSENLESNQYPVIMFQLSHKFVKRKVFY